MKRLTVWLFVAVIVVVASSVVLAEKADNAKNEMMTLTGEIVDTGCYLDHSAKGAEHKSCATKCIANGMAMALLTKDNTLYLLTMSHDDADPYNMAKTLAASMVEIKGHVHENGGMKGIEVIQIKEIGAKDKG